MRIHHVQICILPEQESQARAFYGQVLGFKEVPKPQALQGRGGMWFELGDLQLHIGVESQSVNHLTKAHVAYAVQDLQATRNTLEKAGCPIKESIAIPGMDRFESRDPFGNRLEFLQLLESAGPQENPIERV